MPGSFDPSFDPTAFDADLTAVAGEELSVFESVVQILLGPAQDFDNVAVTVRDESVDNAAGVRLDVYGRQVGLSRDASPLFSPIVVADDPYRRAIRAWIQATHAWGTRPQILAVARAIVDDAAAFIAIRRSGTATLLMQIQGVAVATATEAVLCFVLERAVAAGVRLVISSFAGAPSTQCLFGGTGTPGTGGTFGDTGTPGTGGTFADYREIE